MTKNKMGVMPVNKLLLTMALPMMLSMLVQALYNVVDSIFVARISGIGVEALTAVSISFPIQNLMISLGVGIGVGINALLSRALGEGESEKANKIAQNGIFLEALVCVLFVAAGFFVPELFMKSQTDNPVIIACGVDYLSVCMIASAGLFAAITFERLLQATGRTVLSMISQGCGAIVNIVLDPILIFGLFGMPALGVMGAAIATVIGQFVSAAVSIILNIKKNPELHLSFARFRPRAKYCRGILIVGVPSALMGCVGSFMNYGINKILFSFERVGETAAAVFGIYFKLQSFVFMPVFGLNNGMVPIIAFNYGARNYDRIMKTIRLSTIYAVGMMFCGLAVFNIFPAQLLALFDASPELVAMGCTALRRISLCFVFAGYCIVSTSVFQALGHGFLSMLVSLIRQIAIVLPAAYILARISGSPDMVWWAFPIAEIAAVIICTAFLVSVDKKILKPLRCPAGEGTSGA